MVCEDLSNIASDKRKTNRTWKSRDMQDVCLIQQAKPGRNITTVGA
jgi:hypothetical protein